MREYRDGKMIPACGYVVIVRNEKMKYWRFLPVSIFPQVAGSFTHRCIFKSHAQALAASRRATRTTYDYARVEELRPIPF